MLVTKQSQLDDWFEVAANDPDIRRWLSPKSFLIPPVLGKNSWDAMHFMIGEALVILSFDRSRLEAKIAMYNSGTIADGALALNESFVIGYKSGPWRALRSACCVTNQRSLKLNTRVFGEPWGISTKSAWDAGLGEWVDEAHFRRMRESVKEQHEREIDR
jgi:hypothetical protein